MANKGTNDLKREDMKKLVEAAKAAGWTTAVLSAFIGVSSGTISSWGRGDSMGTNGQRERLRTLRSPREESPRIAFRLGEIVRYRDERSNELATATETWHKARIEKDIKVLETWISVLERLDSKGALT
jgi:type II secretory pathway component PulJ